tara:strand:+ start:510 stop:1136 length:627 start_codon:yes stop_codon:yes gene_type:complete
LKHGKKKIHLGRKSAHRKSLLANLACSLIEHKRINTTLTKAKALKRFVEPIITKSKEDTTHKRRLTYKLLRNKYAVSDLFRYISPKIADRPGGYTRIIKLGNRLGDNAEMAMIELVDFNDTYSKDIVTKKSTRRGRSRKSKESKKNQPNTDNTSASDNLQKDKSAENQTESENLDSKPEVKIKPTKKQTTSENVDVKPEVKDDSNQKK